MTSSASACQQAVAFGQETLSLCPSQTHIYIETVLMPSRTVRSRLRLSNATNGTLTAWFTQVLRAVPKGARLLLECAGAVVAAAPSKFKASSLSTSMLRKKRRNKFTLFSDHNGSLLRRQPGATSMLNLCLNPDTACGCCSHFLPLGHRNVQHVMCNACNV